MTPALQLRDLGKRFGPIWVLRHVDFDLAPGEIHALVGENGAGKSTMIKLVAGVYRPDEGEMIGPAGTALHLASPREATTGGIGVVHQELDLFDNLTVAENITLGAAGLGFLRPTRDAMRRHAERALARFKEHKIEPHAKLGTLSTAAKQIVAIAKALSLDARVLIFDEPTSALNSEDARILLDLIRSLKTAHVAVIYVSHKLAEIFTIADRVTVLRDGAKVGTWATTELNHDKVVTAMLGRTPAEMFPPAQGPGDAAETVLKVRNLRGSGLDGATLNLKRGEIVALAGLPDSGATALLRCLFGLEPVDDGEIWLAGAPFPHPSPTLAIARGCGYLPADRLREGLMPLMNVVRNVSAVDEARRLSTPAQRRAKALGAIKQLAVRATSLSNLITALSGGNQQKALIARWLMTGPKLLMLDDPTRGIDVGAKTEIYRLLRHIAQGGTTILYTSSDSLELAQLADRILVFQKCRIAEEIVGRIGHAELDLKIASV